MNSSVILRQSSNPSLGFCLESWFPSEGEYDVHECADADSQLHYPASAITVNWLVG